MPETESVQRPGPSAPTVHVNEGQAVQAAAAESEDVDSLTMRELADRLGVSYSTLHRWVTNRDEFFDHIGDTVIDNVVARAEPLSGDWQDSLRRVITAMHDEFRAISGYATHLSRPHPHDTHATTRLRHLVVGIFRSAGVDDVSAELSWYIVITGVVGWLAFQEQPHHIGHHAPSFEVYLEVLLRGLPARPSPV